jgi:hypothetical protein
MLMGASSHYHTAALLCLEIKKGNSQTDDRIRREKEAKKKSFEEEPKAIQ